MGLSKNRIFSLMLALLVGGSMIACDEESSDEEETQEVTDDEATDGTADAAAELPFEATGPVARVNGEEIGQDLFNEMVAERVERMPGDLPPQMVEMFKNQTLEFVVDKYLVDQRLEGEDIEVTEEDIDEAFEEFKSRFGDDEQAFEQQLQMMGMTEEDIREEMVQDVELEKFLSQEHDMSVSEEDIEAFFAENEERFAQDEEVHARHILIEVDQNADDETEAAAESRAQEIAEEAQQEDADFEALAREHSEGPTAETGGDLGFFPAHQMVPEFSEVAFDMEDGQISDPVRSQFGFHIIQRVEHRPAQEASLEDARDEIEMQLRHQKRQEVFQGFLEGLKEDVEIEMLEDNIQVNVEMPEGDQGMPAMPHGEGAPPAGGAQPEGGQELELDLGDGEDGESELDLGQ